MTEITYREVFWDEVLNCLSKFMRRERVAFNSNDDASYIAAFSGNIMVGVVGWQFVGETLRYKAAFVMPEFRNHGIYAELWKRREKATADFKGKISAFCTPLSLPYFIKNGFAVVSKRKNGITFVQYEKV